MALQEKYCATKLFFNLVTKYINEDWKTVEEFEQSFYGTWVINIDDISQYVIITTISIIIRSSNPF